MALGSSPHTRDKFFEPAADLSGNRITPAYAGQIHKLCKIRPSQQDHPRIRGTNRTERSATIITSGSPPHTRDKLVLIRVINTLCGITPAYAGQIPHK